MNNASWMAAILTISTSLCLSAPGFADTAEPPVLGDTVPELEDIGADQEIYINQAVFHEYPIGIDDVLEISIIQPDKMTHMVRVSPDGFISFPFIGSVQVRGLTLSQIQEKIENELENGFLKYPIVYVSLVESRSRKFFVYGEVQKPGTFPLEENTTILRAISMAGGFTKFGSSSGVKLLSPRAANGGYDLRKVNINKILDGDPKSDILIKPGDILVVSGGLF